MLIKCPERGKDVSDKAPACIHCGFPLNDIHKENTCLVDGAEYDMTELKNYYAKLTDYEKGEFYRRIKSEYRGNSESFPNEVFNLLGNINEHFDWWHNSRIFTNSFSPVSTTTSNTSNSTLPIFQIHPKQFAVQNADQRR